MSDSTSFSGLLDPSASEWLTTERLSSLENLLGGSKEFLEITGQLPLILHFWLRLQLALEAANDEHIWPSLERETEIDLERQKWIKTIKGQNSSLDDQQLHQMFILKPGIHRWARWKWNRKIDTMFLSGKHRLDKASCRLLRVSDKRLAHELFYRCEANETTFEKLARDFGEGPESRNSGLIDLQPLVDLPYGLADILPKLKLNEILPPRRLAQSFVLIQLLKWEPAVLGDAAEKQLLKDELNRWLDGMVIVLQQRLQ